MRHSLFLALGACALALSVQAADAPKKAAAPKEPPLKQGWTAASIEQFSEECTLAVLTMMRRDFAAAAAQAGDVVTQFPEMAAGPAFRGMCQCIGKRVGTTYTTDDWGKNQSVYGNLLLQEALNGGRCKPEGLLGMVMDRAPRAPQPAK